MSVLRELNKYLNTFFNFKGNIMKVRMVSDKKGGLKIGTMTKTQAKVLGKEASTQMSVLKVIEKANALSNERETFEKEELARSNKALYSILAKIYSLFNDAVNDKCIKEAAKAMREQLKQRGVKVQSNTPALTCFVRFVFNSDRKRAYNYASTLMAAIDAEVKPENLASFIEVGNGVEEIKKTHKMKDETKQQIDAVNTASNDVFDILRTMKAVETVVMPNASVDFSDGVEFAFIVARSIGNGEFELLRAVPKSTKVMQTAAVKELAKNLIYETEKSKVEVKSKKLQKATEKVVEKINLKDAAKMTMREVEMA
jgi:hypothetical protein